MPVLAVRHALVVQPMHTMPCELFGLKNLKHTSTTATATARTPVSSHFPADKDFIDNR
jgi:hypothetical protein